MADGKVDVIGKVPAIAIAVKLVASVPRFAAKSATSALSGIFKKDDGSCEEPSILMVAPGSIGAGSFSKGSRP